MDVSAHVEALEREGALLARGAASAGLGAPVPTCPDWRVRDLVRHAGNVHRWAAAVVRSGRSIPFDDEEERALFGPRPSDGELLAWFRRGHGDLVEALVDASPDLECWTFLPAPSPLAFWARRQAHETAMHRVDAESAAGVVVRVDTAFAADGVDELLRGFAARPRSRLRSEPGCSLKIRARDTGDNWTVRVGPETVEVSGDDPARAGEVSCVVEADAEALYLLLWNRRGADGLRVAGERGVLELWRQQMQVRWSGPS
ncbi:MAG TPA: maleylpyruvate isomerase family mycothiol-dependent enzyme [Acidimicrobiales bacterium]|nr:maleylpyruvate isomerase family mycothiol-dependent enzyme [Acidimicrobiales bacterium]